MVPTPFAAGSNVPRQGVQFPPESMAAEANSQLMAISMTECEAQRVAN